MSRSPVELWLVLRNVRPEPRPGSVYGPGSLEEEVVARVIRNAPCAAGVRNTGAGVEVSVLCGLSEDGDLAVILHVTTYAREIGHNRNIKRVELRHRPDTAEQEELRSAEGATSWGSPGKALVVLQVDKRVRQVRGVIGLWKNQAGSRARRGSVRSEGGARDTYFGNCRQ